jgi:hypothetical protein
MSPIRDASIRKTTSTWGSFLLLCLFVLIAGCSGDQHDQQQATTVNETAPAAPTRLSAIAGDAEVFITWDSVPLAHQYNLYVASTAPTPPHTILTAPGSEKITNVTSPYSLGKLDNGQTYYFGVTAENDGREGPASPVTSAVPMAPQQAPAAVLHLRASYDHGDITLNWDPVEDAQHYNLYFARQPGVTPQSVSTLQGGSSLSNVSSPYTFQDLKGKPPYYFVVTAQNDAGESPPSIELKIAPPTPPLNLAAPGGLKAVAGDGSAALTWSRVADAKDYLVFISTRPGDEGATPIRTTSNHYRVRTLKNGTPYYFSVIAQNDAVAGARSIEVTATPRSPAKRPSPPEKVKATSGNGYITISWISSGKALSYRLYAAAAPGIGSQSVASLPGGMTVSEVSSPYTLKNLENGKTYYVAVSAFNAAGEGAVSAEVSATPRTPQAATPAPASTSEAQSAPFIKLDEGGRPLIDQAVTFDQRQWACVKSTESGLVWEVKSLEPGLHYRGNTYSWQQAGPISGTATCTGSACNTSAYVQAVNAQGYCGFHDWRLPTRDELHALIDRNAVYPAPTIDVGYFPNTVNSYYWTASANAYDQRLAWFIYFGSGYEYYDLKTAPFAVRLVRGLH